MTKDVAIAGAVRDPVADGILQAVRMGEAPVLFREGTVHRRAFLVI